MRYVLCSLMVALAASPLALPADSLSPPVTAVLRYQGNAFEALQLQQQIQAAWGEDCDIPATVSMWAAMLGDTVPTPGCQVAIQISCTKSDRVLTQEMVWTNLPEMPAFVEQSPGSYISNGNCLGFVHVMTIGVEEEYDQFTPEESLAAYGLHLEKTIRDIIDHPSVDVWRCEFYPTQLANTFARPKFQALMAAAGTLAQRRDDEDESSHRVRSAGIQFLAEVGQTCLSHLDQLSVALRRSESDRSVELSVSFQADRKSPLASVFSHFGEVRNRSLSYLHPDYEGFAAIALPIPEQLVDPVVLSGLYRMAAQLVDVNAPLFLDAIVQRVSESGCRNGHFEMLVQTIPCTDKSTSLMVVFPLRDTHTESLENSGIQQVGFTRSASGINGYPCYRLMPSLVQDGEHQYFLDMVQTEDCLALLIGTDAARPAFSEVLRRDFDESPAAKRYGRSAIAVDMPLSSEWPGRLFDWDDVWSQCKSKQPLRTRLTVFVDVQPGELSAVARFDEDAALFGALFVDLVLESVVEEGLGFLFE